MIFSADYECLSAFKNRTNLPENAQNPQNSKLKIKNYFTCANGSNQTRRYAEKKWYKTVLFWHILAHFWSLFCNFSHFLTLFLTLLLTHFTHSPQSKPASQSDFNPIINEMPPPNVESIICYLLFVIVLGSFPSSIAVILFIRLWCLPPLNSVLSQTSTIFRISTSPIRSPETQSTFASLWSREI